MELDTNKLADSAFDALGKSEETLAGLDYSGIHDEKIRAELELARLQGTAKAGGRSTIVIGIVVILIIIGGAIYFIEKGRKKELPTGTVVQDVGGNNQESTSGSNISTSTGGNSISY